VIIVTDACDTALSCDFLYLENHPVTGVCDTALSCDFVRFLVIGQSILIPISCL